MVFFRDNCCCLDGVFRVEYHLGGATYATIKLRLNDLITADLLDGKTRYRKDPKLDANFGWRIRSHMARNERALIDLLGGLNSERSEEPENMTLFPGLSEEDDEDDEQPN